MSEKSLIFNVIPRENLSDKINLLYNLLSLHIFLSKLKSLKCMMNHYIVPKKEDKYLKATFLHFEKKLLRKHIKKPKCNNLYFVKYFHLQYKYHR